MATNSRILQLSTGKLAYVVVTQRCPKCGMMVGPDTLMHGSLLKEKFCTGRGAGREYTKVLVCTPTEKQTAQIEKFYNQHPEYHPLLKWTRASAAERREALSVCP